MIKKLLCYLTLVGGAWGQSSLTLSGPQIVKAGTTPTLTLTLTNPQGTGPVGVQWTTTLPAGVVVNSVTLGGVGGKSLYCTPDSSMCMVVGMNTTTIPTGVVVGMSVKIPATASGTLSFPLTGLTGADATGSAYTLTNPTTYSVVVSPKQDLNGDGKVDELDMQVMVNEVLAAKNNPSACVDDLTGDGKCDILDVLQVVLKALGVI